MSATGPARPDLTRARAQVMAFVAGSAISHRQPSASAASPLRRLPAALETKLTARAEAGLAQVDADHPRRQVWRRVVAPSAGLAFVDAAGAAAGAASGHTLLAVAAGVLLLPLAAISVLGARFAASDPLRLTVRDRRALNAAGQWQSGQTWTGPLASSHERGVVIAAARAAERIARNPAWRSGRLDDQRLRIDLGSELDQIDDQAHRIASARLEHGSVGAGQVPVLDAAWDAALNRVAALTEYADQLDGYDQRRAAATTRQGDPVRDANLLAGVAGDEIALDQIAALTYFLSAGIDDPLG